MMQFRPKRLERVECLMARRLEAELQGPVFFFFFLGTKGVCVILFYSCQGLALICLHDCLMCKTVAVLRCLR